MSTYGALPKSEDLSKCRLLEGFAGISSARMQRWGTIF